MSSYCVLHAFNYNGPTCPRCFEDQQDVKNLFIESPKKDKTFRKNPKAAFGNKKIPAATVSQLVMMEVAVGMLEGAYKYGRHNYRNNEGIVASVYYEATRRHLDFWWEGEDIDPASKLSHITKAIASLMVLRDAMLIGTFVDNRPPRIANISEFQKELEIRVAELQEMYPNPVEPVTELNKRK